MNNKTIRSIGLAAIVGASSFMHSVKAEEQHTNQISTKSSSEKVKDDQKQPLIKDVYIETGWHSEYLGSYGFSITPTPVIQSSLGFSVDRVNFSLWSNYDPKQGLTELDPGISATWETKYLKITPQFNVFTFPSVSKTIDDSLGLTLQTKHLPLDVSLFGVQAFGEGSHAGRLFQLSLGKTLPLTFVSKRLTLGVATTITYNDHYFVRGNGFSVVSTGVNANYDLGKGYSVSSGVRAQMSLQDRFGKVFKDDSVFEFSFSKKF